MWTIKERSYRKIKLFMLIINDYSRLTWVSFLKEKSEAFEKIKVFKALTENQIGRRLKACRFIRRVVRSLIASIISARSIRQLRGGGGISCYRA